MTDKQTSCYLLVDTNNAAVIGCIIGSNLGFVLAVACWVNHDEIASADLKL